MEELLKKKEAMEIEGAKKEKEKEQKVEDLQQL